MTVTQYIGSRYVPIFANPIDWDNKREYEPLTIVSNKGNSYTSRQAVPKGIDITNEKYWTLTGNYNSQVESYRQETKNYVAQVGEYKQQVTDAVAKVDADLAQQKKDVSAQLESQNAKITSQLATQDSKITSQLATQDSKVTKQLADNKLYVDTEVGKVSNYRQAIIDTDLQLDLAFIPFTTEPFTVPAGTETQPSFEYHSLNQSFHFDDIPSYLKSKLPAYLKYTAQFEVGSADASQPSAIIRLAITNKFVATTGDEGSYIEGTLTQNTDGSGYTLTFGQFNYICVINSQNYILKKVFTKGTLIFVDGLNKFQTLSNNI